MLLKLLELCGRKRIILDRFGEEYMHRYYLLFKEKINAFDKVKPYPNIFIHKLCLSDEDRDVHDHPWNYLTVILSGGYWEWVPVIVNGKNIGEQKNWRGPGSIIWRRAGSFHRLEMPNPSWTLFMHGWRKKEWGFLTKNGFVESSEYIRLKTT
jgi:hypothetical protein